MKCPACHAENEEAAEACRTCGQSLAAVIRPGSVIASRYEVSHSLGKGGMGMVYKAHDRVLEEDIAIKVLRADVARSPEMARRFRSEIRLARKVTHRNVCRIHEYGEDDALRYISMELIEGIDLKQVLKVRQEGLPREEAFDVSVQIARGLQAIHDVGIIHRDLKTANIMRDSRGVVKLMDFGIAKQEGGTSATAAGDIVGTPEYMSPEQARGQSVDARSDLYALAVVIHEVFSGDVPFRGDTPIVTIFKHIQDQPRLEGAGAPEFPAALIPVLRKGLAKSPADRFGSADDVAEALKEARSKATRDAAPRPKAPPAAPEDAPPPTLSLGQPRSVPSTSPAATAALARAETVASTPTTPLPVTPTPKPGPLDTVPTAATQALPTLPEPAPAAAPGPSPSQPTPAAELHPASPQGTGRQLREAPRTEGGIRAARQQTQRLAPPVAARMPPAAPPVATRPVAVGPGRRLLILFLILLPLLVMGTGILLVGRLLRSATTPSASPLLSDAATPPPVSAPRHRTSIAEDIVTVRHPTTEPTTPSRPEATPAAAPSPAQVPSAVGSPAPGPSPRPTVAATPAPRPTEPTTEQVHAQQLAGLLGQADAAYAARRWEEAARRYDDASKVDAGNAAAGSGRARAQWALVAIRRVFRLGSTTNVAVKAGKGPVGFDTADVEMKSQDFHCQLGIEITPPAVRPGDSYEYVAKAFLASDGKKPIKIKSVQANLILSGAKTSAPVTPLAKEVPVNQRLAIADVAGSWSDGMTSWSLELIVTGDKGDTCRNTLRWQ
jgi:serine/threonine-protein kinase